MSWYLFFEKSKQLNLKTFWPSNWPCFPWKTSWQNSSPTPSLIGGCYKQTTAICCPDEWHVWHGLARKGYIDHLYDWEAYTGYVLLIFCSLLIPLLIHIVSFYWHFVLLVNKQGETIHKNSGYRSWFMWHMSLYEEYTFSWSRKILIPL